MQNTFSHFIHDYQYALQQVKAWRNMGHSVKMKKYPKEIELTITKKQQ